MSSFNRQHHGRSRPPPARNRSGYHPPTSTTSPDVDPHYLDYLRTQVAQLTQQISELSQPRYSSQQFQSRTNQFHPTPVSIPSSSHRRQAKPSRNPSREGSKWRFYAVKNGLNGDDVYSSWNQAHRHSVGIHRLNIFSLAASARVLIHMTPHGIFSWTSPKKPSQSQP